jgi:hypothetical protein
LVDKRDRLKLIDYETLLPDNTNKNLLLKGALSKRGRSGVKVNELNFINTELLIYIR